MRRALLPQRPVTRLLLLLPVNLLLLALLAATIWFDNAANRGIVFTPDPTPIAYADGPRLGVNAFNLHVEPDPAVVTRTLELARDMGASYVRMQAPWDDIEIHGRGDFSDRRNEATLGVISAWDKYDRIVATANRLGLELVIRLERAPPWASERARATAEFQAGIQIDGNSTGPPDDFADYANFVRTFVERYDGDRNDDAPGSPRVRFFQLWNEPNLKNEWNWQTPRPEDFVALLRMGYEAAKAANADAVILFPSLAPTDGLDSRAPMTELEYLDAVYQAGGAAYFDIMSGQAYGLGQPPDENRYIYLRGRNNWSWTHPIDTRNDVSRIVLLREVMERNGDGHKAIWVGEFGWNSAPESIPPERRFTWGQPVSEEQKADYIVGQIERARREWPWMGVMHVWMLRYGGYREPDANDPTPYFALVQRDWQLLPAYTRLKNYMAQPAVAGVGTHTWQHPAVEPMPNGWRLRFSGNRLTLLGGLTGEIQTILNGTPVTLSRTEIAGQQALQTPALPDSPHTLEVIAPAAQTPERFIVARERPMPWLWTLAPALLLVLLTLSGAATMQALFASLGQLRFAWGQVRGGKQGAGVTLLGSPLNVPILIGMLLGLLICYRASAQLPLTLLGLAIFSGLALLRPNLALLFVPLTVPLFFMPKGIWDERFGIRTEGLRIPLHEIVLLVVLGATIVHGCWLWLRARPQLSIASLRVSLRPRLVQLLPVLLFVAAGTLGVLIVPSEGRSAALREWRWLIVEPLIFYGLLRYHGQRAGPQAQHFYLALLAALCLGGASVGLIGLLQFAGLNLAPLIGTKAGFSDDRIFVEGVQRVNSVYGHPNNLGLYLGRIWPLAACLALGIVMQQRLTGSRQRGWLLFWGLCALLALGGLLVSFSRGAWIGAFGALLVTGLLLGGRGMLRRVRWLSGAAALLAVLAIGAVALLGIERFNLFGESSAIRLKTWASALAMLRDYPLFGIGLDQFVRLYPQYIDPALANTNERFTAHPHNLLLDTWLRLGLAGVLAYGWLIVRFYRRLLAPVAPNGGSTGAAGPAAGNLPGLLPASFLRIGLLATMTAALIHGMVDSFYFWPDLAFTFWLLIALAEWLPVVQPSDQAQG